MKTQQTKSSTKKTKPPPKSGETDELKLILKGLVSRIEDLGSQVSDLKSRGDDAAAPPVMMAPPPVVQQVEKPKPKTLRDRVQEALSEHSMDFAMLAAHLKVRTRDELHALVKSLAEEGQICNVNNPDHPIWTWRIGPDADTATLHHTLVRLLKERPTFQEDLVRATGADPKRVDSRLVEIRRSEDIVDMAEGTSRRALYFIMSSRVKSARLEPKKTPNQTVVTHGAKRNGKA